MASEPALTLYGYWRSSASYRVRIALNLKALDYVQKPVHLVRDGGEQHASAYRELNPQRLVPVLSDGRRVIRQSIAIIEYLDEAYPETHALLPSGPRERAQVRELALLVACDVHPLSNLRVMHYLEQQFAAGEESRVAWMRHWMAEGFSAFEEILNTNLATGRYCYGDEPTMADLCLVPQMYNARRFGLDLEPYPLLQRIEGNCLQLAGFQAARPENQPDAA